MIEVVDERFGERVDLGSLGLGKRVEDVLFGAWECLKLPDLLRVLAAGAGSRDLPALKPLARSRSTA
jgi:hypothetical protein